MSLLALQQVIIHEVGVPYLGLLILGIILAVLGKVLPQGVPQANTVWNIMFWLGVALIIIWIILFAISFCC